MVSTKPTVDLAAVARDNEGFLLDPDAWRAQLARALAHEAGQAPSDEHWRIIGYIRNAGARANGARARKLLGFMRENRGEARGTRRYLLR